MAIEESIYDTLTGDAATSALVGTRVYPLRLEAGAQLPAIAYQIVTPNPQHSLHGGRTLDIPLVQIEAYAETYTEARTVADAAIAAMENDAAGKFQSVLFQDLIHLYKTDIHAHQAVATFQVAYIL